ncbi:MAG: arsenate reductase ArsC [Methanolinea sp.]|nr:arsenate reductase ArsC [Methanolinea sp.]
MFKQEKKRNVLFICTHNSARSQMAEGYLRARFGDRFDAFSAGTTATSVHPLAIAVMKEIGIDISGQRSKQITEFAGREMDLVVTVCDSARSACSFFPWAKETLHVPFPDPVDKEVEGESRIDVFRKVRDEIVGWIDGYFAGGETG